MKQSLVGVVSLLMVCTACSGGSGSGSGPSSSPSDAAAACPSLAGSWKITAHCDSSFIGQSVVVTQTECSLTFEAPFEGFTGSVASDGKLAVGGPESCTGTGASSSIAMSCTPGTCTVTLAR